MNIKRLSCAVLWLTLLGTAHLSVASDDEHARRSLVGLTGVHVIVEPLTPEVERQGLTRIAIQTDAELRLRKAGIRVFTDEEFAKDLDAPFLGLAATISTESGSWGVSQFVDLYQGVILQRNPSVSLGAITWGVERVNGHALPSYVARLARDVFNDMVDQFINAYLAMNPRK